VDVDAYVTAHRAEWDRLDALVRRAGGGRSLRRLSGAEVDELVSLYQRVATHLSVVRSATPDPALVGGLSSLVARARSAVTGSDAPAWRDLATFFTVTYPVALYRSMRWWVAIAAAFVLVSGIVAFWVGGDPHVQATIAAPDQVHQLVDHDFQSYYSSNPAGSFAAKVWTNNAWVAALSLMLGVFLLPVVWVLWQNALNVGVAAGLMAANHRLELFFGLILPHGLLELTCVFVAAGAGLRLGWAWVDPGPRTRSRALREEGQAAGALALGLAATLAVSGAVEAFVTPSPLPTWARVGIGVALWAGFISYAVVLGGRAARAGELGDIRDGGATDVLPTAG
jgi:uncharacterized membrane protein SpoIIM required for sporulation